MSNSFTFEPEHDKTYKITSAPSEDSDQPGHLPSLISLHCLHEEALGPKLSFERTAKTLIRLGGCTSHLSPQPLWGWGIAAILTFFYAKLWYMLRTAGTFFMVKVLPISRQVNVQLLQPMETKAPQFHCTAGTMMSQTNVT